MTTTEKVIGGIIVVGAIGGLVYVLKKDDKKPNSTAVNSATEEYPAETTPAQIETIEAIKEQKAMFVEKKFEPLVLPAYAPATPTKANTTFIKPFKAKVFEPIGGRPETPVIKLPATERILSKGSKGKEVEALQRNLGFITKEERAKIKIPPNVRMIMPNLIDGDFGQKTEDALFKKYGVRSINLSRLK